MNRIVFILLTMCVWLSSSMACFSQDTDGAPETIFGLGIGQYYGVLGVHFEREITKHTAISAAFGTGLLPPNGLFPMGMFGGKYYFQKPSREVRVRIQTYYRYMPVKHIYGRTANNALLYGLGWNWRFNDWASFDIDLLYGPPLYISSDSPTDVKQLYTSFGFNFRWDPGH